MAYTNPRTWADETIVNSDDLNTEIRDNVSALYSMANAPYRNLLYNGSMQLAQRATSAASLSSPNTYNTVDRWNMFSYGFALPGVWTQNQTGESPNDAGYRNALSMTCTTAKATLVTTDALVIGQRLEGFDVQRLRKGTSSTQPLTLSFWVVSNVPGTYIVELYDSDNNRHIARSYTIASSGVWQKVEVTVPGDTAGALDNDNANSFNVAFWLAAGPSLQSSPLQTSWGARTDAARAAGQVNLASAINNYWKATQIQLETGSVATPFEIVTYGDELRTCQRYYENGRADLTFQNNDTARQSNHWFPLRVIKRAGSPTTTLTTLASTNVGLLQFFATDTGAYLRWNSTSTIDFSASVIWTVASEI